MGNKVALKLGTHPSPTTGRAEALLDECRGGAGSGRWGVLRSEVKEEGRAQPGPGDMSAAERPTVLIPLMDSAMDH